MARTTAQACRDLGVSWHTLNRYLTLLNKQAKQRNEEAAKRNEPAMERLIETKRDPFEMRLRFLDEEDIERIRKEIERVREARGNVPRATPRYSSLAPYVPPVRAYGGAESPLPAKEVSGYPPRAPKEPLSVSSPRLDRLPDGWVPLPDGWLPVTTFARQHNLNDRSVIRQSLEGRILMPQYEHRPMEAPWGSWSASKAKWYAVTMAYRGDQLAECERVAKEIWPERWRD
jgi:hypothetical protein